VARTTVSCGLIFGYGPRFTADWCATVSVSLVASEDACAPVDLPAYCLLPTAFCLLLSAYRSAGSARQVCNYRANANNTRLCAT